MKAYSTGGLRQKIFAGLLSKWSQHKMPVGFLNQEQVFEEWED